jgi:hypothetical protein
MGRLLVSMIPQEGNQVAKLVSLECAIFDAPTNLRSSG